MANFAYKARDNKNIEQKGVVEAFSLPEALKLLRKKNYFIIDIEEVRLSLFDMISLYTKQVSFNDIVVFTRQLSTMITAGLMLPEALQILEKQMTNRTFQSLIADLRMEISSGKSFSQSLLKYPKFFSPIFVSLIHAGEISGSIDIVLSRLSDSLESQREFRSKIIGVMIYPIIILAGMSIVVVIMMVVVIPRLSSLYLDFNMELPMTTQILIGVSNFLIGPGGIITLIASIASFFGFMKWRKTPMGKEIVDRIVLKIPLVGPLATKIMLVEFTRTFAMLIAAGIHITDSLKMLETSMNNIHFQRAMSTIESNIERGFSLSDSINQHAIFPPILPQMVKVGEETGKLDTTLVKLSQYFQSETEHLVKGLTTAIEPLIMIMLGFGVGFIVISIITPIYNLTSNFR